MAVALDLRDDPVEYVDARRSDSPCSLPSNSIHPRTKLDVGYRLSRSGLAVAYGQQVEFQGPIVANVIYSIDSRTVNLTYTAVENLELRNRNGFEVCSLPSLYSTNESLLFQCRYAAKARSAPTIPYGHRHR